MVAGTRGSGRLLLQLQTMGQVIDYLSDVYPGHDPGTESAVRTSSWAILFCEKALYRQRANSPGHQGFETGITIRVTITWAWGC